MDNFNTQIQEVQRIIQTVGMSLSEGREKVMNLQLSDLGNNDIYKKNMEQIDSSKQQIHHIIDQYFKDLSDNYIYLQSKYPSKDVQQLIIKQIDATFQDLSEYQTKLQNNTFTAQDYQYFQQGNFLQVKSEVQDETSRLTSQNQDNQYSKHTEQNMPQLRVQNKVVEGLYLGLNQYASVQWPGETSKNMHDNLSIQYPNYFQTQAAFLPFINEEDSSITAYDLATQQVYQSALNQTTLKLNYQSTVVQTPSGELWVSGGVNSKTLIQGSFFHIDVETLNMQKKSDMLVKRVGHALCYVPNISMGHNRESTAGYLYAIGGRTDKSTRTKLCERFNIQTGSWEAIDKLNQARGRPVVVYYKESHSLYAFFGTDSQQQNLATCERFDLLTGKWTQVLLQNYLPGFDMSFGCGVVVNQDQILLFGGLRDSLYFKEHLYFNKKLLLFNPQNDSMTVLDTYLPVDFIPVCQPVIFNNTVVALGTFMSSVQDPPNQQLWLDGAFAIEISAKGANVVKYLDGQLQTSQDDNQQQQQQQ